VRGHQVVEDAALERQELRTEQMRVPAGQLLEQRMRATRLGLGRALLREYLTRSKANKAEAWFLEVRAGNSNAISLYESEGFAEYCRRADYYGTGQDREDAVLMSRLFDFG